MSFEWKKYTIADVSKKVVTGKTPPGTLEKYFGGDVLFVTPTDMGDNKYIERTQRTLSDEGEAKLAKQRFECGIVVSCIGWQMGKSAIVKNAAVTNQQINTIIPNNELIDIDFLYYILDDKRAEIFNLGATATRTPILKKSLFEKIEFYAPRLEHQKNIGSILSCLDNKIINNQKINQTLKQMTQALFKSWFVDFEPVKAKMAVLEVGVSQEDATFAAMKAISGKDTDALTVFEREHPEQYAELKSTAELFPSAMQESELGEIPEGWNVIPLENATSLIIDHRGKTPKKLGGDWSESGYPAISAKNIKDGRLVRHDAIKYVDPELYLKWMKDVLLSGDILMTSEAPLGELLYLAKDSDYLLSQRLYGIRADNNILSGCYLYLWLQGASAKADISSRATGSTVVGIRQSELKKVNVMVPGKALIASFSRLAAYYLVKIESNEKQNIALENLRDTLLPKLLSGEITLPEAEQAVSEAENV